MAHLQIAFLDVGQGDTTVIFDPDSGEAVIVDCVDFRQVMRLFKIKGIRHVRALIITHAHADHYSGTVGLLDGLDRQGIPWDACIFQWQIPNQSTALLKDGDLHSDVNQIDNNQQRGIYRGLLGWAKKPQNKPKHILPHELPKGSKILDAITFCHPEHRDLQELFETGSLNNLSYVLKVVDSSSVFLMGDLEAPGWQFLRKNYPGLLQNDVVKFPHHGVWRNASVAELLDCICPQIVIVSVGTNNKYGHPARDVLQEIASRNIQLICTQATALCGENLSSKASQISDLLGNNNLNTSQHQYGCPCAGTVMIELGDQAKVLCPHAEIHKNIIKDFMDTPQCNTSHLMD